MTFDVFINCVVAGVRFGFVAAILVAFFVIIVILVYDILNP